MNEIKKYKEILSENIKHMDEKGKEYWFASKLQNILGYHQWRNINDLIERAGVVCIFSLQIVSLTYIGWYKKYRNQLIMDWYLL